MMGRVRALTPAVRSGRLRLGRVVVGLLALLAAACGSPVVEPAPTTAPPPGSGIALPAGPLAGELTGAVGVDGAWVHLQALQRIADENGGNRAAGTPGYEASVEYVSGVLRAAGFDASTPTFAASDDDGGAGGRNVIAQTRTGNPAAVVVIGAHLDSVPEGPGIVDNGSGVASVLEIAVRLGADPAVQNTVRFAFFGDEESGAVGATGYVEGLPADDLEKIKLYLNVDMVASPNGGYFAQGGEGRDEESAGPAGSATIGRVLADQLAPTGVTAPEIVEFVGDDETPFVEAGIPVGGAENGDAEEKTARQAAVWGGQAGEVYDRCYHEACDDLGNVNREVLDHYLRAVAGTLAHFATSTDELR
jgi:aminopeptidase S